MVLSHCLIKGFNKSMVCCSTATREMHHLIACTRSPSYRWALSRYS